MIDGCIGFEHMLLARDYDAVELLKDGVCITNHRESFGRPVGKTINLISGLLKATQHISRARNLASHHLNPTGVIYADSLRPLGMLGLQLLNALGKGFAAIHLQVPRIEAYIIQKPLALLGITEIFIVEVAGIPIHQHSSEIEYYIFNLCHISAKFSPVPHGKHSGYVTWR